MENKGVLKIYKISRWLYEHKILILPKIIKMSIRIICGATIPYKASIGDGTIFPHGASGVVLHEEAIIGRNCKRQSNVVIGGRSGKPGAPVIGDNVLIGTGAVVLGKIKIGDNVAIGANAVVLNDIESNSVAVGIPAKVIKKIEDK